MGKLLNCGYGAIFGSYWIIYAVVSSFASVFMLARGYSNSQIGITLALANVLAVVMQPFIADFADRSKRIGAIGTTEIMTICMMVFTVGMFVFKGGTVALCVVFVLLIGFHSVLQPLFNSMAFRLEEWGIALNFGIARAVGSLAYALFVAAFGTVVERFGVSVMPVAGEVTCLLLLASLAFTGCNFNKVIRRGKASEDDPSLESEIDSVAVADEEEINLRQFIKRNKMFFIMSIGIIGLYFSNAVLNFYMAQIVHDVGGTTEDMGRILGVMAFLEIPTMVFFKQLKNRFSCRTLLKVASVGFMLKITLCWLASSVLMLYLAHLFQLVGFALFLPGMVYFTNEIMSKGEAIKGQALYTTMITLTTVFSSLAGGWILDAAGPKNLTFIASLATAAGAVLIIAVIDRVGKND